MPELFFYNCCCQQQAVILHLCSFHFYDLCTVTCSVEDPLKPVLLFHSKPAMSVDSSL